MPDVTLPRLRLETYLRLGHLVYSAVRGHPVSIVDTYLAQVSRRIEFTVESFLLAPFLLQGTDLVAVVPERAAGHLRRTADVRFLEPPMDLPPITEMLWWNPRHTMDPDTPGFAPASPRSPPNSTRPLPSAPDFSHTGIASIAARPLRLGRKRMNPGVHRALAK